MEHFIEVELKCDDSTKEEWEAYNRAKELGFAPTSKPKYTYRKSIINTRHIEAVYNISSTSFFCEMMSGVTFQCRGQYEQYFTIKDERKLRVE